MALRKLQNFIGGEHRDAVDGKTSTLINPSTGEGFAEAPVSGQADVDAAMQAAERGFEQWRDATPPSAAGPSTRSPTPWRSGPRR